MLSKEEALSVVLQAAPAPTEVVEVPLQAALARVLARDAISDVDLPPFEKSSMDGWAVRASETREPGARLKIAGRILAGEAADKALDPGQAIKVMTGAPVPPGADAVIMVEDAQVAPGGEMVVFSRGTTPDRNICHRGEDIRRGERVIQAGTLLNPPRLALLGMLGVDPVPTWKLPRVAVIPTGNELVEPGGLLPGPAQIRESNGVLLAAQVQQVSPALQPLRPGIARDDEASLNAMLDVGLGHDVLCLSGGVSMGDRDLVAGVLKERGLEVLLEKAAIKPGKPILFGRLGEREDHTCFVFGLPGNPVSSLVTFELFVRPFLLRWMGMSRVEPDIVAARYVGGPRQKSLSRTQHLPARVRSGPTGLLAEALRWHGSADMRGLREANGLILIDAGGAPPQPGDGVAVQLLPGASLGPATPTPGGGGRLDVGGAL